MWSLYFGWDVVSFGWNVKPISGVTAALQFLWWTGKVLPIYTLFTGFGHGILAILFEFSKQKGKIDSWRLDAVSKFSCRLGTSRRRYPTQAIPCFSLFTSRAAVPLKRDLSCNFPDMFLKCSQTRIKSFYPKPLSSPHTGKVLMELWNWIEKARCSVWAHS